MSGKVYFGDVDCIWGRNVNGICVPISSLIQPSQKNVCIVGKLMRFEDSVTENGNIKYRGWIADDTGTLSFRLFLRKEDREGFFEEMTPGGRYIIRGVVDYDDELNEPAFMSVSGIKPASDDEIARMDTSDKKRVELNLHTNYSPISTLDVKQAIHRAKNWGMNALAITDYVGVRAFPEAYHEIKDDAGFKLIYGFEAGIVDDLKPIVLHGHGESFDDNQEYVAFCIETTGFSIKRNKIIEIEAIRIDSKGRTIERFSEYVNPGIQIPYNIESVTGISDDTVMNAPGIWEALPRFLDFSKDAILVTHDADYNAGFIREYCKRIGLAFDFTILDTRTISFLLLPNLKSTSLEGVCAFLGLSSRQPYSVAVKAERTAKLLIYLLEKLKNESIFSIDELNYEARVGHRLLNMIQNGTVVYGTLLVKNEIGRRNLYRLISDSHMKYYNQCPRMPFSEIIRNHDGLLFGSGGIHGYLYQALLRGYSDEEIERLVNLYDYLEIQPTANNRYMIEDDLEHGIQSEKDLQKLNKKIVALGKKYRKLVVATGDVHFLDPTDAIYRAIVMEENYKPGQGKMDSNCITFTMESMKKRLEDEVKDQPPLYFRTTEEMLKEFDYLGAKTAWEVVVENSNKIADMIERIPPIREEKGFPEIDFSDELLRQICEKRAREIYGTMIPAQVCSQLDAELNATRKNGNSVYYLLAQKLVRKSYEGGYPVGIRGSVGASLIAYLTGITEINPLPPHYICPHCHFVDFDSDPVRNCWNMMGHDLPDCECPKCGNRLERDGFNIPVETFLGMDLNKKPNIVLNFAGEYKSEAEGELQNIVGEMQAVRTSTAGYYSMDTLRGFVNGFCEKHNIYLNPGEVDWVAKHCICVKSDSGIHPGRMIVIPSSVDVYEYTPLQYWPNNMFSEQIVTHFDRVEIGEYLLEFDLLTHTDYSMIHILEKLTGLDAKQIPLDDPKVLSLVRNTDASEGIDANKQGCLGIREFETDTTLQIVKETEPKCFSELVRVYGLSHGTGVWFGNARELIQSGICKLQDVICFSDDIMIYLVKMGISKEEAYAITDNVRKGNVYSGNCENWKEWKELMKEHCVPEWYVRSCEKIHYLFPKAHGIEYIRMAWRITYFKLYYPLEFYAAYFSFHPLPYEKACQGKERLESELWLIRIKEEDEREDLIMNLHVAEEMYTRGFEFMPINIYQADDKYYKIIDGKIMPSLQSIKGMGVLAAKELKEAAKKGPFKSQEDLESRVLIKKSLVRYMAGLGILGDLPEMG